VGKYEKIDFEFIAEPQVTYFAVERNLSAKLRSIASSQGMSADTILNLWIQEKMLSTGQQGITFHRLFLGLIL